MRKRGPGFACAIRALKRRWTEERSMPVEIICTNCGAESFLKREPLYEGFKKILQQIRETNL
jgi:hypothetical protein